MAQYLSQARIERPIWLEPSDISFLRNRLVEAESDVETFENQLEEDEAQISELIHRKNAKLVEISSIHNILSPVRRLPFEILSEIFELSYRPENGVFTSEYDVVRYTSMLSRVCVAWKAAAYDTPRIWSKLCLSTRKHRKVFMAGGAMKEWIARSQGLPLEVHLSLFISSDNNLLLHQADQILDCIFHFRHQIQSINLAGYSKSFLPLLRLPRASFPLLEGVFLYMGAWTHGDAQYLSDLFPRRIDAFLEAPRLQKVVIVDPDDDSFLKALMLPVEQLISLKVTAIRSQMSHLTVYQDILHRCTSLVRLTVDLSDWFGFDAGLSIHLPALRVLDVSCQDVPEQSFNLLHALTTPVLEDLTLRWTDQDLCDLSRDVAGFQNRSSTELSSLTLVLDHSVAQINTIVTENLINILATFPTIRSLWVDAVVDESANPYQLAYHVNPLIRAMKGLVPKLTDFHQQNLGVLRSSAQCS